MPYGNSPQGMEEEEEEGKCWILSVPAMLQDLPSASQTPGTPQYPQSYRLC